MEEDFAPMLATLGEVHQIILMALNGLADGAQAGPGEMRRLLADVSRLADQADTVMTLMLAGDADRDLFEVAEALGEYFQDAEARIRGMIAAGWG